jgi:hypothetical protein
MPVADRAAPLNGRKTAGIALLGAGGLALAIGATLTVTSFDRNNSALDQQEARILRDQVHKQQLIAGFFYAGGAVSAVTGLVLLVLPSSRVAGAVTKVRAAATRDGAFLGYGGSF